MPSAGSRQTVTKLENGVIKYSVEKLPGRGLTWNQQDCGRRCEESSIQAETDPIQ
jgi:hypothetical protein